MIDTEGIPAIGLPGKPRGTNFTYQSKDKYSTHNPINEEDEAEKLINDAYDKKTTLAAEELRNECSMAYKLLKNTGELPFSVDSNCLSCMSDGRDSALQMKLFKTACLTY
jgi:hypothetical protein